MTDVEIMMIALDEARQAYARGECPVGAVITRNGDIVAQAGNRESELSDPTAHAEILVLREAGRRLGQYTLPDCTVYTTLWPCPMCANALLRAKIPKVICGAKSFNYIYEETFRPSRIVMEGPIMSDECRGIFIEWAMKTQAGVYWGCAFRRKINMKAALKWVLQDENVHTAIPAVSNYDEMMEDLSVMEDLSLTPVELRDLRLGEQLGLSVMYCQQCRRCLNQCPSGVDIPILMRASMYAFGHQQAGKARGILQRCKPADFACTGCKDCRVRCTLGLDIRAKAVDVARLLGRS
jgi:tRNA(adenine34) deaminase